MKAQEVLDVVKVKLEELPPDKRLSDKESKRLKEVIDGTGQHPFDDLRRKILEFGIEAGRYISAGTLSITRYGTEAMGLLWLGIEVGKKLSAGYPNLKPDDPLVEPAETPGI